MNILKKLNFDNCRFIASLLVVAIHIYPFASLNEEFDFLFTHTFCRIAVPLFIMITGYYLIPKILENKNKLISYTKKIMKIYLISIIIYLPINIYAGAFKEIDVIKILKVIFIDGTFYHLWYFPALISGLWITYFMIKKLKDKHIKVVISLLFLIGLFGDSYYFLISKINILNIFYNFIFSITNYTRNGLFYVPIFLYLGYNFNNIKIKEDIKTNATLLFIYLILMEIEAYTLYHLNIQRHDSMYIFLICVMFYLFSIIIQTNRKSNIHLRNISTTVYIIHPLIIIIVRAFAKIVKLENVLVYNNLIHYLFVITLTIIFSIIVEKIKEVVKNERSKRKNRYIN